MAIWSSDERRAAFGRQLAHREQALAGGDASLGWKLGYVTPAALASLDLDAPIVGHLLHSGLVRSGASVSLAGWVDPRIEPEIAVFLGSDLDAGATNEQCVAAISAMSLAFELVDVTITAQTAVEVLDHNAFQRGVALGEHRPFDAVLPPVSTSVNGEPRLSDADPADSVGDVVALVGHAADVVGRLAGGLRAGSVIITGAIGNALPAHAGEHHRLSAPGLGELSVEFTA